ncbi:hypothetical protein [Nocardioides sp. J54]|uniref:hypothetical protein n=1 Tax=Nocardioides sp. J54 TaxID=935866 RepID=UPI0004B96B94|nr:hypothetical protein [Nocardioides sp. J54]
MTGTDERSPRGRLGIVVDALGARSSDEAARRLLDAAGGAADQVVEHGLGVPAVQVRKLRFASGVEVVLHDDVVVGVLLHLRPVEGGGVVDLSSWLPRTGNDASLKDLERAFRRKARFAGIRSPYVPVGRAFAQLRFAGPHGGGWKERGNLATIVVTLDRPGLALAPDADECPACSTLAVLDDRGGLDVDAALARMRDAVEAGKVEEEPGRVPLDDVPPLHASGLMDVVESQLTCRTCARTACLTLHRDAAPTFTWVSRAEAERRPLAAVPPVERWGSPDRVTKARRALTVVDHEPAAWFLLAEGERLYLDARYSYSAVIDDSALVELDATEREAWRTGGHAYLQRLAEAIHMSAPYEDTSPYYARDLFRRGGEPGRDYRGEVTGAVVEHRMRSELR